MSRDTACAQGHQWQSLADDPSREGPHVICSVCGLVQPASDATLSQVEMGMAPPAARAAVREPDLAETAEYRSPEPDVPDAPPTPNPASPTLSYPEPVGRSAASSADLPEAVQVPGYTILGVLGRGGMGVIYKARQEGLKRLVALKMILAGAHARPEDLARFRKEAEAVAHLQHPNVVQIYEIGEHNGRPYLSLEFVDGGSLARNLAGRPLLPEHAAELAETLARTMHYCHQRGIVHRDLKPANILLARISEDRGSRIEDRGSRIEQRDPRSAILDPRLSIPKITDFGLAKRLEGEAGQTQSGAVLGTPSYMAPEQAGGKVKDIGPLTDVYALGAILYEMLTGRPPFRGESPMDTVLQVLSEPPVPPTRYQPRIPRDLETICLKAIAKEPSRRYHSALALAQDLERFRAGEPILGRREGAASRLWRKARRSPVATMSLIGLAAALLVALVALLVTGDARRRTIRDRQITEYKQAIEAGLTAEDWTEAHLEQLDDLIRDLERVDPEQAAAARERLTRRFGDVIQDAFSFARKPILEPADVARIEAALGLLASRDPARERVLRQEFKERCGSLEQVIDSKASLPGPAGGAALALTQVPCGDHVEIEAEFSRWVNAPRIGLALNVDPQQETGYAFLLVAPEVQKAPTGPLTPEIEKKQPAPRRKPVPPRPPRSVSLGTGRQEFGGRLTMQILRNGVRLREQVVPVADGPLVLRAIRKGERLTFLVKDRTTQHALTFEDLFPFSGAQAGVFGVYWPNGAEIELKAWRQALPAAPSPLERGDRLYALKQYDEALSAYRTTASATRDPEVRQEARCKEALCLQALLRPGDAAALFEQVAAEQGPRWPVVAACQLWPERVRQGRFEDADAIFHRLTSHYQPEQVAVLIPDEVRQRIRAAYHEQIRRSTRQDSYYLVRFDPERARNLDRALAVEKFLQGPQDNPQPLNELKVFLIPGYHRTGQLDRAVQMAEELLADPGFTDPWQQLSVVEDYTWLMLERGTPEKALVVVNRFLLDPSGGYRLPYLSLLVTRARVHAARKQWEQAEKDVEELFRQLSAERYILLDAHILRGFLRERRGDQAGALEAWRQGWSKIKGTDAMFSVQGGVLASLANDLTVADAEQLIARAMAKLSAASPIASALKNNLLPGNFLATVLRERFRTKRGLDYARRFALHDLTPLDYHGLAFPLTVAEAFHQGAVTGELTPEQDDLLWKAAYDLYQGFAVTGKFTEAQAFQGILAWMGTSGVLGWSGLARTLDPSSRGPLAYVYGHRFLRLKKPAEAADLFRTAVKDAPPGSPLRRLAEAELERLKPAGKGG